ncbi:RNA-directed DNA polymerase, eukaryota, reverse transcriptase zinc-binding domain protein [Tanacetum coccineum]|uniref:RNA-directed DNA polymerase, eukaryota, reverse transcriptase zinc-binding domain protein n=1 Tax=Tanacetum coccineum TaxID=301880 RepID=A0ABQ5D1W4_9ASTR
MPELTSHGGSVWMHPRPVLRWVDKFNDESFEGEPNGDNLNNGDDVRGDSEIDEVPDTIFEEKLSNTNDNKKGSKDANSLKYPPGFTPRDDIEDGEVQSIKRNVLVDEKDEGTHNIHEEVKASGAKKSDSKKNSKGDGMESVCSGNFKNSETPHLSGSILLLMNELVKCFGGILYVWDSNLLKKLNTTISDYFVLIRGVWVPNGKQMFIISVYDPQELSEKKMLRNYLSHVIANWKGEVIIMGDFNEVRNKAERFGSVFNVQGANDFNMFISSAGLKEVPLGVDGFVKLVEETWNEAPGDTSNAILNLIKKLKFLKKKTRAWNIEKKNNSKTSLLISKTELAELDAIIDKGDGNDDVIQKRTNVVESILKVEKLQSMEAAQKAKIKWAIKARLNITMDFPHNLSSTQQADLEIEVTNKEIKRAVWDCGVDKSPGSDGFTFGFYHRFWKLIERDVVDAVKLFFHHGFLPKGSNYSFIALILKTPDANMVKDFRPISLISSFYKIIAKILVNRLVVVLEDIVNEKSGAVGFKVAFDLHGVRVVDECMFKGVVLGHLMQLSHMFYAHNVVFMGQWNDAKIDTIMHVLDCFYRGSGLRINMSKSKLIGISVDEEKVDQAASKIGCVALKAPFSYLGSKVDGIMSRIRSWNEIVDSMIVRLSKWKMKTLSIGGRLTLLKSVLGSMPIYHMSIFKVPRKVLQRMESIRCHFFNGADLGGKKLMWVKWKNVLASKEKGGIGVSSLYALNRALMFKWVWRFITQRTSLWTRVIKAIHEDDGKIETCKGIDVAAKLAHISLDYSFCRDPRGGVEQAQFIDLRTKVADISLVNMRDWWTWALEGSGDFSIASVRKLIDDKRLPDVSSKTRWIKAIPIKVNIHAWKVRLDCLPTRINISCRCIDIESILCPICDNAVESSRN